MNWFNKWFKKKTGIKALDDCIYELNKIKLDRKKLKKIKNNSEELWNAHKKVKD